MRTRLALAGSAVAFSALLAGCGGSDTEAFCETAAEFAGGGQGDASDLLAEMRENAPDDVADDIDTVLEVSESLQSGSMPADGAFDQVTEASTNIEEYIVENCG